MGATGSRTDEQRCASWRRLLRALAPGEVGIGTLYLSGETPQGSIGLGYAAAAGGSGLTPARASLSRGGCRLVALSGLAQLRGAGSAARRSAVAAQAVRAGDARGVSQFLGRLLSGELRQGALIRGRPALEALARGQAQLPVQRSARRAADMYS